MVKVTVSFYGVTKDSVSEPETEVQMPQEFTLRQLLGSLKERYGEKFEEGILDPHCGVKSYVRFFVNRESVDNLDLDRQLKVRGDSAEAAILVIPTSEGG